MWKNFLVVVFAGFLLISCNRSFEKALKSNDPVYILQVADEMYAKEKWPYAIELYKKIASNYVGTEKAEDIAMKAAYANYYDKNYKLAANQFKNFYLSYSTTEEASEALYMSAYCYYLGSPEYNLDQSNTFDAISQLQNFIDTFPESEKVEEANGLIKELELKLQKKAFKIAESYYKTLKYKSANVSFANFMDDFPDSKYREEAYMYMYRAQAQLALKSLFEKKNNRLINASTTYRLFTKAYPNSQYLDEANQLKEKIDQELSEHQLAMKKFEEYKKNKKNGL